MAALVQEIARIILIRIFFKQSNLFVIWDKYRHLPACSHLMEPKWAQLRCADTARLYGHCKYNIFFAGLLEREKSYFSRWVPSVSEREPKLIRSGLLAIIMLLNCINLPEPSFIAASKRFISALVSPLKSPSLRPQSRNMKWIVTSCHNYEAWWDTQPGLKARDAFFSCGANSIKNQI